MKISGDRLQVQGQIPLRFGSTAATGLPVRVDSKHEPARGIAAGPPANPADCADNLGTTKYGVDSEGVVVDPRDGSFWVPDEYVPSVLHVAPDGDVLGRFVPTGYESLVDAPVVDEVFPEVVGQRFRGNRGFEGIALSPDGTELYTALQSPTQNPTSSTNGSLATRISLITFLNDNDFGILGPIPEQMNVLRPAPPACPL